jgi:hypothetical protein
LTFDQPSPFPDPNQTYAPWGDAIVEINMKVCMYVHQTPNRSAFVPVVNYPRFKEGIDFCNFWGAVTAPSIVLD